MVGPAMDFVSNPLGAVRILFDKACSQSPSVIDSRSDWGAMELLDTFLYQQGGFKQVPEINSTALSAIPANSLVRFRGLVQDMLDVEYYIGAYKDGMKWHTTKFTDAADLLIDEKQETQMWDRRLLYCVPVPGENNWVREAFAPASQRIVVSNLHEPSQTEKRSREPEGCNDVEMELQTEEPTESKRLKVETVTGSTENTNQGINLNMPLGESSLLPCLVKVYDGGDADIRLNDVVEFTGVLTFDPQLPSATHALANANVDTFAATFMEDNVSSQLPQSRVPRLHCITHRKLSSHKILEALPYPEAMNAGLKATPEIVRHLRGSILKFLTDVLGGDHLTAEYLLLHLLSQVHSRVDSMAIGKISLNIVTGPTSGTESSYPMAIAVAKTIQNLLPWSHVMPLSLHNLNKMSMAPRKDYNTNRLLTGSLQLAEGTYLILDETVLSTGQLNSVGIQNVQSLKYLMECQKVEYDFQYYKLEMTTDIPVLIISQARSRLLPADIVVHIRSTSTFSPISAEHSEIASWRFYLNSARNMEHTLDSSMQQFVQDELVNARQHDRSLTQETFHRWLNLARLLCLSYGESNLSMERWQTVREMERLCAERLRC